MTVNNACDICNGKADIKFKRTEVWSNDNWRLTTTNYKDVKGFCYLEPKRHIKYITELDGQEATEFGPILSEITKAIKTTCNAKLVYVYIYGDHIPHLHVHLAPHTDGDIYFGNVVAENNLINAELLLEDSEREILIADLNSQINENLKINIKDN